MTAPAPLIVPAKLVWRQGEELRVVRIEPSLERRKVQRLELVADIATPRTLGKPQPFLSSDDAQHRLIPGASEEVLETDAEDESNPQQRRQRRKQLAALDLRQHRRRQPGVFAELDQPHLLLQAQRADGRANRVLLQSIPQRRRQHRSPSFFPP